MLGKEEQKEHNIKFWGEFDKFMKKEKSLFSKKVNWLTYRTRVQGVYLRLTTNGRVSELALEFQNKSEGVRELQVEQLKELTKLLEDKFPDDIFLEEKVWREPIYLDRLVLMKKGHNYFDETKWPIMFEHFKTNLILFDEFWSEFFDLFKELEK